jgi:hypothetical protein
MGDLNESCVCIINPAFLVYKYKNNDVLKDVKKKNLINETIR